MRTLQRATATVLLGLAVLLALAGPAQASCAGPPTDSPYAFTGTVVEVEKDGRLAHVVLDDGSRVVVHGSPELGDRTATSVDRHFAAGARYEFHPFNDNSPFQDNACSATRRLAGPTPGSVPTDKDQLPGWLRPGSSPTAQEDCSLTCARVPERRLSRAARLYASERTPASPVTTTSPLPRTAAPNARTVTS